MNKITTQILEELYTSEPSFRERDEHIQKIVAQMMDIKPEVTISENFKKVLKNRLISEMSREKEQKTVKKNRFFRIFWYALGAGALASFAISFGLLEMVGITGIKPTIETPKKENLALVRNIQTDSSKDSPRVIAPETTKITTEETVTTQDSIKEPETPTRGASMKKTLIPEHTTLSNIQPEVAKAPQEKVPPLETTSLMTMKAVVAPSAKKQPSLVAYVGDMLDTETHKNRPEAMTFGASLGDTATPPPTLMMAEPAADSMDTTTTASVASGGSVNNESVSLSESPAARTKTESGVSFSEIIELAQKEANLLIVENERSLYVLKTPIVSYVSRESKTQKNTVELIAVYTFPLERTDGKIPKVKEISIEIE